MIKEWFEKMRNNFVKWTVEISIHDTWIEDGFIITSNEIVAMLQKRLSLATSNEIEAKIVKSPPQRLIKNLRGEK